MVSLAFKDRVLAAMISAGMSKADLARRSGMPYHALDKYLKGVSVTTGTENAQKLARALGITIDGDQEYEELRALFYRVDEKDRETLLSIARRLAGAGEGRG